LPPAIQLLSTLCLALCLALVDSGLPLSSPFSSLSTACSPDGDLLTDPSLAQEQASQSLVTVMTDCSSGRVISTHTQGVCSLQQLESSLAHAEKAGEKMKQFYQKAVQRRLAKDAKFSHLNIAI
ncbi:Exosome complex component RRP46, partial [Geodia barretti]